MSNDIEWKMVKLGDVAEFLPTNTLSRDELNYSEGEYLNIHYGDVLIKFDSVTDVLNSEIPFVSLNKKFSDRSLLKNGDIVMADTAEDESVGKVTEIQNIDNYKVVSGLHTLCMRFQENLFAPKFAGYYLNSPAFHNLLLPYMHGTKVTSISKGDVKKIVFPILYKNGAPDLETQKQIAQKLGDMDSLIAAKEKLLAKKRNLKVAAMQRLIKDEEGENWKKVKLGDVAEFLPTNTLSRDELNYSEGEYLNIHYGDVLIKFESVTDVLNSEIPYVSLNKKFSDKSLLKNGDIVMADTAEDESVGKVTEIQNIGNCKVVSGLHTLCIRFQENLFAPKFAGYYLNSPAFHNLLLPYMHGTKVTSISKGDVKKIYFPIPYKNSAPDLTEQRRIASILSGMDSEIAAIEKEITKLQKLKTAMMQKMFCFGMTGGN